jgi:hypothetical protein
LAALSFVIWTQSFKRTAAPDRSEGPQKQPSTIDDIHCIHRLKNKRLTLVNFDQRQVSDFGQVAPPSCRGSLMHTKDILAAELRKAGLPLMAKMAAEGVYSSGLSLHAMPDRVLRRDLEDAHSELASKLLRRVDAGEFEATEHEIDEGNARMVTSGMIVSLNTPSALSPPLAPERDSELKAAGASPSSRPTSAAFTIYFSSGCLAAQGPRLIDLAPRPGVPRKAPTARIWCPKCGSQSC